MLIATRPTAQDTPLADGDCLVVTQKIVSKAEDRLVPLDPHDLDARRRLVESESVRIVRPRGDLDHQRDPPRLRLRERGHRPLERRARAGPRCCPVDSDRSAKHVRDALRARVGRRGRGDRLRHVRPPVAPGPHRRRDRRERHRRGRRPPRHHRRARPRAAGHRGRDRRRDRGRRRARDGQGRERSRSRSCAASTPSWFGDGSVRELIRPPQEDLFR